MRLLDFLIEKNVIKGKSELRRLVLLDAVRVNDILVEFDSCSVQKKKRKRNSRQRVFTGIW